METLKEQIQQSKEDCIYSSTELVSCIRILGDKQNLSNAQSECSCVYVKAYGHRLMLTEWQLNLMCVEHIHYYWLLGIKPDTQCLFVVDQSLSMQYKDGNRLLDLRITWTDQLITSLHNCPINLILCTHDLP